MWRVRRERKAGGCCVGFPDAAAAIQLHRALQPVEGDLLAGEATVVPMATMVPGLFLIPATVDLAGAEIELISTSGRQEKLDPTETLYVPPSSSRRTSRSLVRKTSVMTAMPSLWLRSP